MAILYFWILVDGFSYIVKESSDEASAVAEADFVPEHAASPTNFHGVFHDVLAVTGAITEAADGANEFFVVVLDTHAIECFFTDFEKFFVGFFGGLFDCFADIFGSDFAFCAHEFFHCDLGDAAINEAESGKANGVWEVVENYVDI